MSQVKVPVSTYRLQLHKGFTFQDAAAIAPYLWELGISHVYSSPYLQAAPGSMHGYDVVDHQRVNEELGGEAAFERFAKTLGENGLGQVLDIVPNHMAIGAQNKLWWDVLENGQSSRYASFFDIDWMPAEERLREKVLVPILGDQYGRVLEAGEIEVSRTGADFWKRPRTTPVRMACGLRRRRWDGCRARRMRIGARCWDGIGMRSSSARFLSICARTRRRCATRWIERSPS
jgi:maltooligosyltrehalose synthase